ncbi:hypothetical protein BDR04DRAFT_1029735, partial [Suillus decipiens]
DVDIVLVFSGLFSAVNTTFIVAMESNLSPDPNDTTHALLTQLVQIGLGNLTAGGSIPAAPASMWSPFTANIRIQFIAYASLSMSSLAAFRAVLSKQWLKYYRYAVAWRMNEQSADKRSLTVLEHGILILSLIPDPTPVISHSLWSCHQCQYVACAVHDCLGYHCHNDLRVFVLSLTAMATLVYPACPF